jgi:hypothetical protein
MTKEPLMTQKWNITVETQSGETYTGAMTRQQPEIVNGFVAIATESGEWNYLKPDTVTRMHFAPVVDKADDNPVEVTPTPDEEQPEKEKDQNGVDTSVEGGDSEVETQEL